MSSPTIDQLRASLGGSVVPDPAYAAKMLHPLPAVSVVDRARFILDRVKGKRVLEFGASGPMHDGIVKVAASCLGVDREDGPGVVGFDLDDVRRIGLPGDGDEFDVIVCGEVLEHLSNPGWFLTRLRRIFPGVPVLVTVPNAYSAVARAHALRGIDNVNRDHVAWHSPRTLQTLLERAGYRVTTWHYYHGEPRTAEGLIAIAEGAGDE